MAALPFCEASKSSCRGFPSGAGTPKSLPRKLSVKEFGWHGRCKDLPKKRQRRSWGCALKQCCTGRGGSPNPLPVTTRRLSLLREPASCRRGMTWRLALFAAASLWGCHEKLLRRLGVWMKKRWRGGRQGKWSRRQGIGDCLKGCLHKQKAEGATFGFCLWRWFSRFPSAYLCTKQTLTM